jgi:hypothetical protein
MTASAVVMALVGIFLLYGGLTCCIGIAWYHSQHPEKRGPAETA